MARILVADDDRSIRDLLLAVLEAEGHDVVVVSNGAEATRILGAQGFDLLITDHLMPGLTGVGLVAWVRKNAPEMKILVMSSAPELARRAREVGADGFMQKPFENIDDVSARVRELVPAASR